MDAGKIGGQIGKIGKQLAKQPSQLGKQPAKASDVNKFQEAMKMGGQGPQGTQPPGMAHAHIQASQLRGLPVGGTHKGGIGDAVLKGVEKLSSGRQKMMHAIESATSKGGKVGVQQMMSLQYNMMQMSTEQEIVGKIAGQISQGASTLFRNQ